MPTRRRFLSNTLALSFVSAGSGATASGVRGDTSVLQTVMASGRFVAYQPTALKAIAGRLTQADDASIRADLETLRPWFDGLITYGAYNGNERVPDIAAELGFHAVIVGVWDPADANEVANALAAWRRNPKIVAGLSLGNEIVFGNRGTWKDLLVHLNAVRANAPGLPLTVSEPFAEYLDHPEASAVLDATDFMLVNIHPVFEPWFKSGTADNWTDFVVRVTARLQAVYSRPILVKETGVPTGPASSGFNEDMQRDFYKLLARRLPPSRSLAFAWFTAFDEPWRTGDFNPTPGAHPEEAYWGLFTETRLPKPAMRDLSKLSAR
jgi:exo-beta-1,3-glucanase (GH17 family)